MVVIGIVGLCGAGKTSVARILEAAGFSYLRFGDATMEELKRRGLAVNERNERTIREEIRAEHGMAAYAVLNYSKIRELSKRGDVVIDGLYSWEEYLWLKKRMSRLLILAVYTLPQKRAARLSKRSERPLTLEEMRRRDLAEIENLNKAGPIAIADYTVLNNSTKGELKSKVQDFIRTLRRGKNGKA